MRANRTSPQLSVILFLLALGAAFTIGASAQSPAVNDPLPALLSEVHALRVAMEQQATVGPRVQLTLARLNIEEQRVTHLAAELNNVRQQLAGTELALRRASDELAEVEKRQQIEGDPGRRRELEEVQRGEEFHIRQHNAQLQQLRTRENDAAQALAAEQARWVDLSSRLDELERLLSPAR